MPSHAGTAGRTGGLAAIYVVTWAVLAVVAAVYLAVVAVGPEMVSSLLRTTEIETPASRPSDRPAGKALVQVEGLGRAVADLRIEVGSVKEALARQDERVREISTLRAEVGDLKTNVAGQEERQRAISGRLASFEAQAMAHAAATQASVMQQPVVTSIGGGGIVTGSVEERAEPSARLELKASKASEPQRAERKAPEQSTAVASALPSFGPAKVISFTGPVGLQLGTGPSPDDLRLRWLRLNSGNSEALHRFEPRYVQAKGGDAPIYRLIAGPVASSEEATRLCNQLKAKKLSCSVTAFSGQPL